MPFWSIMSTSWQRKDAIQKPQRPELLVGVGKDKHEGSLYWRALHSLYKYSCCWEMPHLEYSSNTPTSWRMSCRVDVSHLSFGDEIGHDGGVAKLCGQMAAAAALAVDQRGVGAVLHELHHHGQMALSGRRSKRAQNKGHVLLRQLTTQRVTCFKWTVVFRLIFTGGVLCL